ncbi:hypothetical protein HanPSC8_Chr06g0258551 [Helianthus annuus]|nr:hypothetical protein HanPSC8_Chr06g0258551 [Helianthus annuus]
MCNEASVRRNMEKSNELFVQVRKRCSVICSGFLLWIPHRLSSQVKAFFFLPRILLRLIILNGATLLITSTHGTVNSRRLCFHTNKFYSILIQDIGSL